MTRDEAIRILKYNSNVIHKTINGETDPNEIEALDMAIKALQLQQDCKDYVSRQAVIDALDKRFDKIPMEQTAEILKLRKDLRGLPSIKSEQKRGRWIYGEDEMTNKEAINLLRGLEQSLDGYCELNDEGKKAFNMAVSALEQFGNSEQLPSAQFKGINKGIHEITESDKISYAIICDKFPSPHVYFNTYDEAARWARFNQPNYRPYYIIERSEHFEIVGEVR